MKKKFIKRIHEGESIDASYIGYKFFSWDYWYISFSFRRRDYRIGTFGGKHFQSLKRKIRSGFPDRAEAMDFIVAYHTPAWIKEHEKHCATCQNHQ